MWTSVLRAVLSVSRAHVVLVAALLGLFGLALVVVVALQRAPSTQGTDSGVVAVETLRLQVSTSDDPMGGGQVEASVLRGRGRAAVLLTFSEGAWAAKADWPTFMETGSLRGATLLVVSGPRGTDVWVYRPMIPRTYHLDLEASARRGLGGSELTADDLALLAQLLSSAPPPMDWAGSSVVLARGREARSAASGRIGPTPIGDWENAYIQLLIEGVVTTTFDVRRDGRGEVDAVRVGHPNAPSRTVITLVERRAPGPLPACGRSLELCATLAGFLDAADLPPTAYTAPGRRGATAPHDCDLFDSDAIVVAELSHEEQAPKWGAAYLVELARACAKPVDCVFVERAASADWNRRRAVGNGPALHPSLDQEALGGTRIVGVDMDWVVVEDLADRLRASTPATRYRAEQALVVDRNRFMVNQMVRSDCATGVLVVGAGHVADPRFDPALSVPGLLASAGWSVSVFEAGCVPPAPDLGWDGDKPRVRLTRADPAQARMAVGAIEAECAIHH